MYLQKYVDGAFNVEVLFADTQNGMEQGRGADAVGT
jgi:hypothetical protein